MEANVEKILIKKVRVIDPASPHHRQQVDILIENEQVKQVAENIEDDEARLLEQPNLHISPGWFDLRVNFCDPGREEREDIKSGINAAIAGGFTGVGLSPDTNPPIDSKADIEYVYQRSEGEPVNVYPYGSITRGLAGEEISEMYDMFQAGAVGFSNGKKPISNAAVSKLAMLYAKTFAPPLHLLPLDSNLSRGGQMHEGKSSTYLGLKGIPELAEEVSIMRDLHLADYAETGLHVMNISAASTVEILRSGKRDGCYLSADVAAANLLFNDEQLADYDTNYKLLPPLRGESDRRRLLEAVKQGFIKVITSDHSPVDIENKKCEFEQADWGMIGLQTLFGGLGTIRDELDLETLIACISIHPREVLNLECPRVEAGSWAEFTLFDPDQEWVFEKDMIESHSHNTPFIGRKMRGKPLGIINNGYLVWTGPEL